MLACVKRVLLGFTFRINEQGGGGGGWAWTSPGDEPADTHRESLEHSLLAYSKYGDR